MTLIIHTHTFTPWMFGACNNLPHSTLFNRFIFYAHTHTHAHMKSWWDTEKSIHHGGPIRYIVYKGGVSPVIRSLHNDLIKNSTFSSVSFAFIKSSFVSCFSTSCLFSQTCSAVTSPMEKHVVEEKVLDASIDKEDNTPDPIERGEDHDNDDANGGDAALANASWQFKLIALATALMLPSTLLTHVVLWWWWPLNMSQT